MNIVVCGAASAIAQETIKLWADKRASFVLIDKNEDHLAIVSKDAKTRGATHVISITHDFTDIEKNKELVEKIIKDTAPIDILFIAYGTLPNQKQAEVDASYTHQQLTINFTSVVSLTLPFAQQMQQQAMGTIAVITSVAGDRGRKSNFVYGSAKGALSIFLAGLRHKLSSSNVQVLTIKPGFVDTPMTSDFKKGILWSKPSVIAHGIVKAIDKKKSTVYLPWWWRYIMIVIRLIPEKIFVKTNL